MLSTRAAATFLVLLLVAPAAAWTQDHGDAGRTGAALAPPGAWDVLEIVRLHSDSFENALPGGAAFLPLDGGAIGMVRDAPGSCYIVQWSPSRSATQTAVPDCYQPALQAVDAGRGHLLVCTAGAADRAAFEARDAAGQLMWRVTATDVGAQAAAGNLVWGCRGAATDLARDTAYVPFFALRPDGVAVEHRFAAIDLSDGSVAWTSQVGDHPKAITFFPTAATATQSGLVVVGRARCGEAPACLGDPGATVATVATFDRAGGFLGVATPATSRTDGDHYAAALGPRAVLRLGASAWTADALSPDAAVRLRVDAAGETDDGWHGAGPLAAGGRAIMALHGEVIELHSDPLRRGWTWPGLGADSHVEPGIALADGSLVVAAWRPGREAPIATLVRLSPDGAPRQFLPLPFEATMVAPAPGVSPQRWAGLDWVPLGPDRLLVVAGDGRAALIGPAIAEPGTLRANTYYPVVGETVTISGPDGDYVVAWGDEKGPPGPEVRSFVFGASGVRDIVATRVLADDTTRTSTLRLDVGGRPAPGPATGFPAHTPPIPFPTPGASVYLNLSASGLTEAFVDWGDGTVDSARRTESDSLSLRHAYAQAGSYPAVVTVVALDGSSATKTFTIQPGGPGQASGGLARIFDENPDAAWTVVGILVATAVGTVGIMWRRRQRSHVRGLTGDLEAIRQQSRSKPIEALRALQALRTTIRDRHQRGTIDDAQFQLLKGTSDEVFKRIIAMTIGRHWDGLPKILRSRLDAALADGVLAPAEAEDLNKRLAGKGVSDEAREAIGEFLSAWQAGGDA